jgi:vibriolysin
MSRFARGFRLADYGHTFLAGGSMPRMAVATNGGQRRALLIGTLVISSMACGAAAQAQSDSAQRAPDLQAMEVDRATVPTHIRGDLGTFRADAAVRSTDTTAFLDGLRLVLRADGSESLQLRKSARDPARGVTHHRMTQTIDGLEVIGGEMILHVEEATSRVLSIDAQFLPGAGLPRTPAIQSVKAIDSALEELQAKNAKRTSEPRLAFARTPDAKGHLVWVARVRYTDSQGLEQLDDILADAVTGKLVQHLPRSHHALVRRVNHGRTGELLISEGGTTTDPAAANCYQFSGDTYNFFWNTFGRDSYNGRGGTMQCYVYFGGGNARYEEGAIYLGEGYEPDYGNLASSRDTVGHEWGHGIVESEANLLTGEAGAMNEMYGDVFGAVVEASVTGVTPNTWKTGEDWYTPVVPGDAYRYMDDPARDGVSRDFYPSFQENDGAHSWAGIGNLAFYLLSNGGTHPRGKTTIFVNPIGIDAATKIYYLALRDYLLISDGFSAARDKMGRVAQEQYGDGSIEHLSVCSAWTAVGVPHSGSYCPEPPPAGVTSR